MALGWHGLAWQGSWHGVGCMCVCVWLGMALGMALGTPVYWYLTPFLSLPPASAPPSHILLQNILPVILSIGVGTR